MAMPHCDSRIANAEIGKGLPSIGTIAAAPESTVIHKSATLIQQSRISR
jgi:hypothetical protein